MTGLGLRPDRWARRIKRLELSSGAKVFQAEGAAADQKFSQGQAKKLGLETSREVSVTFLVGRF